MTRRRRTLNGVDRFEILQNTFKGLLFAQTLQGIHDKIEVSLACCHLVMVWTVSQAQMVAIVGPLRPRLGLVLASLLMKTVFQDTRLHERESTELKGTNP